MKYPLTKIKRSMHSPNEEIPLRIPWTRNRVIETIRQRRVYGEAIHCNGVRQDLPALYKATIRIFGSFDGAIRAAGLNPAKIRKAPRPLVKSRAEILTWILERRESGLSLGYKAVFADSRRMLNCARREFGSWRQAVSEAGIEYGTVRQCKPGRYSTPEAILKALQTRYRRGYSLRCSGMRMGVRRNRALLKAATASFGGWRKALQAAGIPEAKRLSRKRGKYLTGGEVVAEILRRHKAGIPINTASLHHGRHKDRGLYTKGGILFGSWLKALEAAGFDCSKIARVSHKRKAYVSASAVLEEIQRRHRAGLPLAFKLMERGNHHDRNLRDAARRFHGSWEMAVEAAGIPYGSIKSRIGRPNLIIALPVAVL